MSSLDPELRERRGIASLPVELLVACFLFLPFDLQECLPILHVCRTWRFIALDSPGIWSEIFVEGDDYPRLHLLVDFVLSSTPDYPIHFSYRAIVGYTNEEMWEVVEKHLHRMRSIFWNADSPDSPFDQPAPLLEEISGGLFEFVSSNLFGGAPGNLRRIDLGSMRFPETCPALSTVKNLTFWAYPDNEDSFHRLFELFPFLESMDIDLSERRDVVFLPPGPLPHTLARLRLSTTEYYLHPEQDINRLDLISLCHTWQVFPRIQSLELGSCVLDAMDFTPMLNGVVELSAIRTANNKRFRIKAYNIGEQEYVLELRIVEPGDEEKIVQFLSADPRWFSRLRRLQMASYTFAPFVRDVGQLQSLTALSLIMHPQSNPSLRHASGPIPVDDQYALPLSHLRQLPAMPKLESLEVSVHIGKSGYVPAAADALALVATLALALTGFNGRTVALKFSGFPAEASVAVEVPPGAGYSIVFA